LSVERKEVAAADEDMNGGNEEEWMESLKKKAFSAEATTYINSAFNRPRRS
jgi:cobalamin biosynthesis Co2+ chelatase CbiK